ncbi:hypothetical protein DITRI_Ditri15bG0051300 [Diplodiscus trichospermus]
MTQPINLIFRFLQSKARLQIWLFEQKDLRIEGRIIFWSRLEQHLTLSNYEKELEEMKNMTRQEFVAHLRRKKFRGTGAVTNFDISSVYEELFEMRTQITDGKAYDIAAIKFRGTGAVTNFDISRYDVKRICSSSTLIEGLIENTMLSASETLLMVSYRMLTPSGGKHGGHTCNGLSRAPLRGFGIIIEISHLFREWMNSLTFMLESRLLGLHHILPPSVKG